LPGDDRENRIKGVNRMTTRVFRQSAVTGAAVLGLALATLTGGCSDGFAFGPTEKKPLTKDERMEWWRDARFGLFVHWGLYSVPAGTYKGVLELEIAS
jgi:alpha-L-fucosidase-like protein